MSADPSPIISPVTQATAPPTRIMLFRRRWDRSALRTKVRLLVLGSLAWGLLLAGVGVWTDTLVWLVALGVPLCIYVTMRLASVAIWQPIEQLIDQLNRIVPDERPPVLRDLPTRRNDEVGAIARGIQRLSLWCMRDYHDARQLRRTLDPGLFAHFSDFVHPRAVSLRR